MKTDKVIPWYKQFWPWFLIAIPTSSFIVGGFVINFAVNTTDSLVVDDYYKEGRAINARLDKKERAKYLNITTEIEIQDSGALSVIFHSGRPKTGEAIKLIFYHVTLKDKDQEVLLSRDANGIYRGFAEGMPKKGKWRVTLIPLNEEWKIQKTLFFPKNGPFSFNP